MLVPAATMIVIVLGAIAVDLSQLFLAKRRLLDAAASVANDAAGAGLSSSSLSGDARPQLDPAKAREAVEESLASQQVRGLRTERVQVVTDPVAGTVTVYLEADVDHVFARAVPGQDTVRITAEVSATGHVR